MRKIPFVLFLLLLAAASHAQSSKKITIYSSDFAGSDAEFGIGRYDYMTLVRSGVSVIRSVKVPEGMKVTLYSKDNFTGEKLILTENATSKYLASKGFGDLMLNTSLVVESAPVEVISGPYVTLYRDNFTGLSKNLKPGRYEFADFGEVGNDQLSSVKVPKGLKVILYEHSGYQGRSTELVADASATEMTKRKFNNVASSLVVEVVPEPKPVDVVVPVKTDSIRATPIRTAPVITLYQGNFTGATMEVGVGRYDFKSLTIGNDELSSITIPPDLQVILFENAGFKGRSILLTESANTEKLTAQNFNNITSSLVVEEQPRVIVFTDNFSGKSLRLSPGKYDIDLFVEQFGFDKISSVKVPDGKAVILFEKEGFKGRALYLTNDVSTDSLRLKGFDNLTASIQVMEVESAVEEVKEPEPMITLYDGNFTGKSKQLPAGHYEHTDLGIGNNTVSSVSIPRGLKVTLFEYGTFEGRSFVLTRSKGPDYLAVHGFDNVTTSAIVEKIPESELVVTIYSDKFSGRGQALAPGRYYARDLTIGDKQLSSIRVPQGMRATLFELPNLKGVSVMLDRDEDFSNSKLFNNYYTSLIVEDIEPVNQQPATPVVTPVVMPVQETTPVLKVDTVVMKGCIMHDAEYKQAYDAVVAKKFNDEKMQMALLVTKDKCLNKEQIAGIARLFYNEDQTLEFVKYAYDNCTERETYYTLDSIFKFYSSRQDFMDFLKSKK